MSLTCPFLKVCCPVQNVDKAKPPKVETDGDLCGISNIGTVSRIDNDHYTEYAEFPWMIALMRYCLYYTI